jgi:3D (Asp-Asp-Asp) domain-containing protein
VRVSEEVQVAQTPLPYQLKYQPDAETPLDGQRVIQAGKYGIEAQRVRIRYENGVEVSRSVEEKWQMTPPQDQIVGYGTQIEVQTAVVDGITLEYYRALPMYATSYSPCRSGGTRCYPNTSSGKKVTKGVVAVLLSWYLNMQGQAVYIPGYGYATIEDVGGGIKGRHWIDLGYTDDDYVSWHWWVTVYFLTPIPPNVMAILP